MCGCFAHIHALAIKGRSDLQQNGEYIDEHLLKPLQPSHMNAMVPQIASGLLYIQLLFKCNNKENIESQYHWPFARGSPGEVSSQMAINAKRCPSHDVTALTYLHKIYSWTDLSLCMPIFILIRKLWISLNINLHTDGLRVPCMIPWHM